MTEQTVRTTAGDAPLDDLASDAETVWLVERKHPTGEPGQLVVVYATPDGTRSVQFEREPAARDRRVPPRVPVAETVTPADLDRVTDPETRARFAAEAQRMAALHRPSATR